MVTGDLQQIPWLSSLLHKHSGEHTITQNAEWALKMWSKLWIFLRSTVFSSSCMVACMHSYFHLSYGSRRHRSHVLFCVTQGFWTTTECFTQKWKHCSGMTLLSTEHLILWVTISSQNMWWCWFCFSIRFLMLVKSIKSIDKPPIIITRRSEIICYSKLLTQTYIITKEKKPQPPTVIATWLQKSKWVQVVFFFLQKLCLPENVACTIPISHTDSSIRWAVFIGKWICKIRPTLPDYAALATNTNKVSR